MSLDLGTLRGHIEMDTKSATTALKGFSQETKKASKETDAGASQMSKAWGKVKTALKAIAFAEVAKECVNFVKDVVAAFGEFEQMEGSMDAIFGNSSEKIKQYAQDAYKEVGLSATKYMETASSFSGALLQSLGGNTEAAAEATKNAIQDMADQASVYGKSIEEVSKTYESLARGNYQTLDNLFGGMFKGTKAGLRDMLDYAEQYRASLGETVSYSEDSYADIVSAIHDVSASLGQEGNAQREALGTVEGSLNATKAAWDNFLVALGSGKNVTQSVTNLIEMIGNTFNQIIPVVGTVFASLMESLPTFMEQLAPTLVDLLTQAIDYIPTLTGYLFEAAIILFEALANAVPTIIPHLISAVNGLIQSGVNAVASHVNDLFSAGVNMVQGLINGILSMPGAVANALINIASGAKEAFMNFFGIHSPSRVMAGFGQNIVQGLANGITDTTALAVNAALDTAQQVEDAFNINPTYSSSLGTSNRAGRGSGNITVNNYSPKALTAKESARQFRRTMRQMAIA